MLVCVSVWSHSMGMGGGGWECARARVSKKGEGGVLGDVEVEGAAHRPLPFPAPALDQQATDCHSLHLLHTHTHARASTETHTRARSIMP